MAGWPVKKPRPLPTLVMSFVKTTDSGDLAHEFEGLSYSVLLTGSDPSVPRGLILPKEFHGDAANVTDPEIFQAVAKRIATYTEDLAFSQDKDGNFSLPPNIAFHEKITYPEASYEEW